MNEREKFEAWAEGHYYLCEASADRDANDEYTDMDMQHAWESWQAAQPAASAELSDEYRRGYEAGKSVADEARAELKACREAFDLATRYGRPAGDAQPVRWVHTLRNEHNDPIREKITGTSQNPFGKPGLDYGPAHSVTSEPLYAAPVASQKADDAKLPAKIPEYEAVGGEYPSNDSYQEGYAEGWNAAIDAAIAQQRKEGK